MKVLPFDTLFLETFSDTPDRSLHKIQLPDREDLLTLKWDRTLSREALMDEVRLGRASGLYPFSDLVIWKGQVCLVRDFVTGTPLTQLIHPEGLPIGTVLDLAVACIPALGRVHAKNIIHRALSPTTLLQTGEGAVRVVDLGMACRMPLRPADYHQTAVEWTLAYASPELTGRMNRPQDFRTDYYSLGAVFYHLLTGRPPVAATGTLERIHSILAMAPEDPSAVRPAVPAVLSRLVLKLLAKNPDERYQSLSGLANDLNRCRESWRNHGSISDFELGRSDLAAQLVLSRRLYGREPEQRLLERAFEGTIQGQGGLFLVEGAGGIGKTLFSQNGLHELTRDRGLVFEANFHSLGGQKPFEGWSVLLDGIGRWLNAQPPQVRNLWLETSSLYLRGLERLLDPLIPSLAPYWGSKPLLEDLEGRDRKLRFSLAVKSFLQSLEHFTMPLVLLLDDLHWADSASLDLLDDLLQQTRLSHVLFVATVQNTEGTSIHGRSWPRLVGRVTLGPFGPVECGQFLSDTLRVTDEEISRLATRLMPMSGGHPLLLGFLIQSSYEKGHLSYDLQKNRWNWKLELLPPAPPGRDALPVILEGLGSLDETQQTLLKTAAAIGQSFSLKSLADATGMLPEAVHRVLWPLIQRGLLQPDDPHYRFEPGRSDASGASLVLAFSHPRIQLAVYETVDQELRAATHLKLGRQEFAKGAWKTDPERLYEVATQFVQGFGALDRHNSAAEVRQVLHRAGTRSLAEADFDRARRFLACALELSQDQEEKDRVWLAVQTAEASYFSHHEVQAFDLLERLAPTFSGVTEQLRLQISRINLLYWDNRAAEAVALTRLVLADQGYRIPERVSTLRVISQAVRTGMLLPEARISELHLMPAVSDPNHQIVMHLLCAALPAFFFADQAAYPLIIFLLVQMTLRHGFLPESLVGLSSYAVLLLGPLGQVKAGYRLARTAIDLLPLWKARRNVGVVSFVDLGFAALHFDTLAEVPDRCDSAWQAALQAGDMEYAGWIRYWGLAYRMFLGHDSQELIDQAQELLESQELNGLHQQLPLTEFLIFQIKALSDPETFGQTAQMPPKLLARVEQARQTGDKTILELAGIPEATVLMWTGRFFEAWNAWNEVTRLKSAVPTLFSFESDFMRCWSGLLAAGMLPKGSRERRRILAEVRKVRKVVDLRAKRNPGSLGWQTRVLDAETQGLHPVEQGDRIWEGIREAIMAAGFLRQAALLGYLMGLRLREPVPRRVWLERSLELHLTLGYQPVADLLRREMSKEGASLGTLVSPGRDRLTEIDTLTLVKSSEALVQEIHLGKLMERLIQYAVENVGAQKAYFLLPDQGDWIVEMAVDTSEPRNKWFRPIRQPWMDFDPLPKSVVQSCLSTEKPVVVDDGRITAPFSQDPVIAHEGIRSILCFPFMHQKKISGLMYLANNLTPGVFQEDRLPLLGLLAGQIAVSLENARLYANLEALVQERTLQLVKEKQNSDQLLRNILPEQVAAELRTWGRSDARYFESVTVLFADIVNFTLYAEKTDPTQLIDELDHYFKAFDRMVETRGVEKIKTIGDAYLCVGGLPQPTESHALDVVRLAFDVTEWMEGERRRRRAQGLEWFQVRIGIHTGPVIAGVVGVHKFAYDIWGDTVNIAARMQQEGAPGRVNISEATQVCLGPGYRLEDRGALPAKHKGEVKMFFVEPS